MRKIATILAFMACTAVASAQSTSTPAIDTLTTSSSLDTNYLYSPAKYFNGNDGVFAVGYVGTKISGTINGYAILQSTIDGTNYGPHYGSELDSFALANVATAQVKRWFVSGSKPNRVRIMVVAPSSTQSIQNKGYFIKN